MTKTYKKIDSETLEVTETIKNNIPKEELEAIKTRLTDRLSDIQAELDLLK